MVIMDTRGQTRVPVQIAYFVCEVPQTEIFIHYLRRKLKESIAKEENVQLLERRNRKLLGPPRLITKKIPL